MTPIGDAFQLKQELRDELYRLDFKDQQIERKKSQKWLGMLAAGIGGVYAMPIVESITFGAYESVSQISYGGVAAAAMGVALSRRSARMQRELEREAQKIARPTHELIRFMDVISTEFNLTELSCSRYNIGLVERYLSPKKR